MHTEIYKPGTLTGRNRFDVRRGVVNTFYEGAQLVISTAFPTLTAERNIVVPLWALRPAGYVEWKLHANRHVAGMLNYNENVQPFSLEQGEVEQFVRDRIQMPKTLALLAMDVPALLKFRQLEKELNLESEPLQYGFAIRKQ